MRASGVKDNDLTGHFAVSEKFPFQKRGRRHKGPPIQTAGSFVIGF